jgi:hypothetical protein
MTKSQPAPRKIALNKKSVRALSKGVRKLGENELAGAVGGARTAPGDDRTGP